MRHPPSTKLLHLFWNVNEWAVYCGFIPNSNPRKLRAASKWFVRAAEYIEHQERKKPAKRVAPEIVKGLAGYRDKLKRAAKARRKNAPEWNGSKTCSQCGAAWLAPACGPTHAWIANQLDPPKPAKKKKARKR